MILAHSAYANCASCRPAHRASCRPALRASCRPAHRAQAAISTEATVVHTALAKTSKAVLAPNLFFSTPCGLELFAKLECSGVFSTKGLRDIAKRINRSNLVAFMKDAFMKDASKKKRRTSEKKFLQKKSSEERQELEITFELMVVQIAVLEQHISLLQSTSATQKE